MAEKKLENMNIRMSETMFNTLDRLAKRKEMDRSELARMVIEAYIEKEHQEYLSLHSIFGRSPNPLNEYRAPQRSTDGCMSEDSDDGAHP